MARKQSYFNKIKQAYAVIASAAQQSSLLWFI
jgi:hypothetical protein